MSRQPTSSHWNRWNEEKLKITLEEYGLPEKSIDRLMSAGWTSGMILPDLTLGDLRNVGFKPGEIALMRHFFVEFGIENAELNAGSQSAVPANRRLPPDFVPEREDAPTTSSCPTKLALSMAEQGVILRTPADHPAELKLPTARIGRDRLRKIQSVVVGRPSGLSRSKPEKRILVIGATGSGKTTWINGVANYICGVQWTDTFRFKIVTEEDESGPLGANQAFSQTDFVTSY
jgi:hypothetical protein